MSRSTLWRLLAILLPVLGALVAALPAVDLAYQLRAGAEILDHGAIPAVDSWTFTAAGTPWLDQQWGAQVLLTLAYRLGGWTALATLRAALVGLAFGLLLAVIRRRAPALAAPAATLLVIAAFVVSASALALRPQLFAIDLFAAALFLLAIRGDHPRVVWLIPMLAAAWANLHGTFLLAPAVCGLAWLGDLADSRPDSRTPRGTARNRMLLVGLVAAAATMITPFGPAVWGYAVALTLNPTIAGRVSEWQPPSPLTVSGALVWLSILAVAMLTALRIWRRRREGAGARGAVPWPAVITLLAFGGLAAISGRGTAWWPFVAAFVVAPWLSGVGGSSEARAVGRPTPRVLRRLNLAIVAVLVLAGVALLPAWRPVGRAGVPEGILTYAPQRLVAALNELPVLATLPRQIPAWNPQPWGSWLEFAADDRYAFALDSRIEVFSTTVWRDADALSAGDLSVLEQDRVVVVITDRRADTTLDRALEASGAWEAVFRDDDGTIWLPRSRLAGPVPGTVGSGLRRL